MYPPQIKQEKSLSGTHQDGKKSLKYCLFLSMQNVIIGSMS